VGGACADDDPLPADSAAAAIELLHCASLVHDDLPCFDYAPTRRQKDTVHVAYGTPIAVLTGDALIVLAFETLARGAWRHPRRLVRLVSLLGRAAGSPMGIAAGQAWESEAHVDLSAYQQAKTGALFAAATVAGAAAAGAEPEPWRRLGEALGEAYQVADDLRDVACRQEEIGKPAGRDATLGRPNAAALLGTGGALDRLARALPERLRGRVVFLAVDTDPAADDALRLQAFAESVVGRGSPLRFLTSDEAGMKALTRKLGYPAASLPEPPPTVLLFDRRGAIAMSYGGDPIDAPRLQRDIAVLDTFTQGLDGPAPAATAGMDASR